MKPEYFANQVIEQCDSTNHLARQLGDAGFPHGTWISARSQGAGRGRLGRKWESLEGGLFLSLILRIQDKTLWSWVPMVTAIGAARALRQWNPSLDIRIKWPNDLWISGRKVGGILCEAVGNRDGSYIIVGLGLNCQHAPEGLDQETASLTQAQRGGVITADDVRSLVLEGLMSAYEELVNGKLAGLVQRYEEWAAISPGIQIEWTQNKPGIPGIQTARVVGLGPSGELRVESGDGVRLSLFAEDVKIKVR